MENVDGLQISTQEVIKGQAIYSKWVLAFYDWIVLNISNTYLWQCPSTHIQDLYQKHISNNHLEAGVGTGYFLQHCRFENPPRIVLMDLNKNSLEVSARRLKEYKPEQYQRDLYKPLDLSIPAFDSLGINYVLHCLPGNIHSKASVFVHLKTLLNPKAIVFGSTILGKGVELNPAALAVNKIYNAKGIFSNLNDDVEGLKSILEKNFSTCHLEMIGCVALFWAQV